MHASHTSDWAAKRPGSWNGYAPNADPRSVNSRTSGCPTEGCTHSCSQRSPLQGGADAVQGSQRLVDCRGLPPPPALKLTPPTVRARVGKDFGVESFAGANCSLASSHCEVSGRWLNLSELSFSIYEMGTITLNLQDVCDKLNINIPIFKNSPRFRRSLCGRHGAKSTVCVSSPLNFTTEDALSPNKEPEAQRDYATCSGSHSE